MAKIISPSGYQEIGPVRQFALDSEHGGTMGFRAAVHSLPPLKQTTPHYHDVESAVYMIKGGAVVFRGETGAFGRQGRRLPLPSRQGDTFGVQPEKDAHTSHS